nr:hypothetical protein [Pseudomonas savastanoi]
MALHGARHFDVVAVVGCNEIGTHQKQNYFIGVDVLINGRIDLLASFDSSIMPSLNDPLPLEHGKLFFKLVSQCLVSMAVGEKYVRQNGHSRQVGHVDLTP